MSYELDSLQELDAIRSVLSLYGCEAYQVMRQPAHVLKKLLANVQEKDWRDVYLARLTAGMSLHQAAADADAACAVLQARRAEASQ